MLLLSRGLNESVMVGDEIAVKVLSITDKNVVLGFKAPKIISVHREEIYRRIKKQRNLNDIIYNTGGK